jgi:hypothetical protein
MLQLLCIATGRALLPPDDINALNIVPACHHHHHQITRLSHSINAIGMSLHVCLSPVG